MKLFKKLSAITVIMSFSIVFHVNNISAAEVFTLKDLKREVMSENIDIKIQYEKYYQSQRNVRNNLGEFLPNLSPQLLFWNTTYGVLYAVSPNPSSWFTYRGSNEFAHAERYVSESIKLNILRDLTLAYVSIKHQEKTLSSLMEQESILVASHEEAQRREDLGVGDAGVTFERERKLMIHRQTILMLNSAIAIQKKGLLQAINKTASDDVVLGELPNEEGEMLPGNVQDAIELGLNNSPELVANSFMKEGAQYMVAGAKWSFVSFSGIGFGYPATLAIERSKVAEIQLERERTINKIENQIALAYEQLEILEERLAIQNEIVLASNEDLERAHELYQGAQIPYDQVLKAQEVVYEETRNLTNLEMEKHLQIAKTKRLLGLDATNTSHETVTLDESNLLTHVSNSSFGKKRVSVNLDVDDEVKSKIVSVVYSGDIFDYRLMNTTGNFNLYTKIKARGNKQVKATVLLTTGQKIELETMVQL